MRGTRSQQRGFTLLEILVALVVLGFVLAGLSQGVRFGLRAASTQTRTIAVRADADAVDRVLRRLIEQADPGSRTVPAPITGSGRAVSFASVLPQATGSDASPSDGAAPALVTVALGVDAAHRLMLRWTPFLHAPRLTPAPAPSEDVLLEGVDHLDIAYWGADSTGAHAWRAGWQGPDLPDLIRITLVFPPDDPRRWPPIVAAPMRVKGG